MRNPAPEQTTVLIFDYRAVPETVQGLPFLYIALFTICMTLCCYKAHWHTTNYYFNIISCDKGRV